MVSNINSSSYWLQQKWGALVLDKAQEIPAEWSEKSHKKFRFLCSCGEYCTVSMQSVTEAKKASCKTCKRSNYKTREYWLSQTWGKLRLDPNQDLPDEWPSGSNIRMQFICSCGRPLFLNQNSVCRDYTSCGHCNDKTKEHWLSCRWGRLTIDPEQDTPDEWGPMSQLKLKVRCDCGNVSTLHMCRLSLGTSTTCGRCNYQSKSYWLSHTWGRLKLDPNQDLPEEWSRYGVSPLWFICSCSRRVKLKMNDVVSSCGKCNFLPKAHWLSQKWGKLKLDPNQKLPDEWGSAGVHVGKLKMQFLCDCGKTTQSSLGHVLHEFTQSCGCTARGKSPFSPAHEVYEFVKLLAPDAQFSYWFSHEGSRREYDIYVPSKKLAIEYHGLYWHREDKVGKKDRFKYCLSQNRGDRLLQIYQDEWENNQEAFKTLLKGKLKGRNAKRINPVFSAEYETSSTARVFLDRHHYLGAASGCLTVVARHKDTIVGVWVFMKREEGVVVFHRACWHSDYKAWNPHEKALKLALPTLKEMGFSRMITFSDNRLFTGDMYCKLGFIFEKELKPDYSYTNGTIHKSKYALRVKAGVDEKAEAESKGWYRIWDSGKKRFSLDIS